MNSTRFIIEHASQISKTIQWMIFIICLTGFVIQSHSCIKAYISCPQGVKIETVPQTEMDFPSITFCPKSYKHLNVQPLAYNWSKLKNCGIHDLFSPLAWNYSEKCENPKEIWESAMPTGLEDFGFEGIDGKYINFEPFFINKTKSKLFFKRRRVMVFGSCFTFDMSMKKNQKAIAYMKFLLQPGKTMLIYFHPKGMLNTIIPPASRHFDVKTIKENMSYKFTINYQQKIDINLSSKKCETSNLYDFSTCMENNVHKVSIMQLTFFWNTIFSIIPEKLGAMGMHNSIWSRFEQNLQKLYKS